MSITSRTLFPSSNSRVSPSLAVHPSFDVKSVAELIAAVKVRPGIGCATSGAGSNQHVLLEWFAKMAGIKFDHIPYRGAGQAINDLIAGHVRVAFGADGPDPHYKAGIRASWRNRRRCARRACPRCRRCRKPASRALLSSTGTARSSRWERLRRSSCASSRDRQGARRCRNSQSLLETATEPIGGRAEQLARLAQQDWKSTHGSSRSSVSKLVKDFGA